MHIWMTPNSSAILNIRIFVAESRTFVAKSTIKISKIRGGGGQKLFGTFPKILLWVDINVYLEDPSVLHIRILNNFFAVFFIFKVYKFGQI